jgi:hypothetical protein
MSDDSIDLNPAEFLTVIRNNLQKKFFDSPKSDVKTDYRKLVSGIELPFMTISATDHGDVACSLALDHTLYVGKINFSRFRNALNAHLARITDALKKKEDLNILTSEETGDTLFYLPGAVEERGIVNVLVTACEQRTAGRVTVRLMFLDPTDLVKKRS